MNLISVTEYANLHKITRQAVLKKITLGKLKAIKIGNTYAIPLTK